MLEPGRTLRLILNVTYAPQRKNVPHCLYIFSDKALLAAPRRASIATAPRALTSCVSALLGRQVDLN